MNRWLKIAIGIALFALAAWLLDWRRLIEHLRGADPTVFVAALALLLAQQLWLLLRWLYILAGRAPARFSEHARIFFYGAFLNSITPANLGADLYRVGALKSRAGAIAPLVAAVLRERVFGLLSFFAGYLCSLAVLRVWDAGSRLAPLFLAAAVVIAAAFCAALAAPYMARLAGALPGLRRLPMTRRALAFADEVLRFRGLPAFLVPFAWSQLAWLFWLWAVALVARNLGLDLPLPLLGAIVSLSELVRLVPISFQGIGLREGSFAFLVATAGGDPALGFAVGTLAYLAVSLSLLVCGPIGWLIGRFAAPSQARPTN